MNAAKRCPRCGRLGLFGVIGMRAKIVHMRAVDVLRSTGDVLLTEDSPVCYLSMTEAAPLLDDATVLSLLAGEFCQRLTVSRKGEPKSVETARKGWAALRREAIRRGLKTATEIGQIRSAPILTQIAMAERELADLRAELEAWAADETMYAEGREP